MPEESLISPDDEPEFGEVEERFARQVALERLAELSIQPDWLDRDFLRRMREEAWGD